MELDGLMVLAATDWPIALQGGPGKAILVGVLGIIGLLGVLIVVEWDKVPAWVDSMTDSKWELVKRFGGMSDNEAKTFRKKLWLGVVAWFAVVGLCAMFIPEMGQKRLSFSRVVESYEISSVQPSKDFDRRLLTDNGDAFIISQGKGTAYPVRFLALNANVESDGIIEINGNKARLVSVDGSPQPKAKSGMARSLF